MGAGEEFSGNGDGVAVLLHVASGGLMDDPAAATNALYVVLLLPVAVSAAPSPVGMTDSERGGEEKG